MSNYHKQAQNQFSMGTLIHLATENLPFAVVTVVQDSFTVDKFDSPEEMHKAYDAGDQRLRCYALNFGSIVRSRNTGGQTDE